MKKLSFSLLAALLICGCYSPDKSNIADATLAYQTPASTFSVSDYRQAIAAISDALIADAALTQRVREIHPNGRAKIEIQALQNYTANNTSTHLNRFFVDGVKERLLVSGNFTVTDAALRQESLQTVIAWQEDASFNPDALPMPQTQTPPDFRLVGYLDQITDASDFVYYTLRITLVDIRTGELIWTKTQDIRKER